MSGGFGFDRRALRRAFDRASGSYDRASVLQDEVRTELLERLAFFRLSPQRVLDLGAGTGAGSVALRRLFGRNAVVAVDIAEQMLQQVRGRGWPWQRIRAVAASATALPLRDACVDLVFCNLMLQWCDEPQLAFAEIRRVLRPGGLLLFATFGPGTLQELASAWQQADPGREHVSRMPDMPALANAMSAAGLQEPVLDRETRVRHYASVAALVRELRGIGAVNAAQHRRRSLTGRGRLRAVDHAYEQLRTPAGLPATWEIYFGAAFAGDRRSGQAVAGVHAVPVERIGHRKRQ